MNDSKNLTCTTTFPIDASKLTRAIRLGLTSAVIATVPLMVVEDTQASVSFFAEVNLANLSGPDGFRINGVAAGNNAGLSVSGIGDINGDGLDDFIVGAPFANPNGTFSGTSYVVFGRLDGFPSTLELFELDGTLGFAINGESATRAGFSVASAGDINGDGIDDLIIGAPSGNTSPGAAYVVFGRSEFPAVVELAALSANDNTGFKIAGNTAGDRTGSSVAGLGDVNGDGLDDVIIGAPSARPNGNGSGASYVVFGRDKDTPFPDTLSVNDLNGSNGFQINGEAAADYAGGSVAGIGDINDDGVSDILIGASIPGPGSTSTSGAAYVVYGQANGFTIPVELSALTNQTGLRLLAEVPGDYLGAHVAGAGDINGDGVNDFLIGSPFADANGGYSGVTYVVFGQANSTFTTPLDLDKLNGEGGFRINGAAGDHVGFSAAGIGDINGDGIDDVLVGAYQAGSAGAGYVIFGRKGPVGPVLETTALLGDLGFRINGIGAGDFTGYSVAGAGDINGDGHSDLIIGALRADINGSDSGSVFVVFGNTTVATPSASTLDFGPVLIESSSGTQVLTMTNNGQTELTFGEGTLTGSQSAEFSIETNDCLNQTLVALEQCSISVAVTPGGLGPRAATLTINSNASDAPTTVSVTVQGQGPEIFQDRFQNNP